MSYNFRVFITFSSLMIVVFFIVPPILVKIKDEQAKAMVSRIIGQGDKKFLVAVKNSMENAKKWLFANVLADGLFVYEYPNSGNNSAVAVRQLMSSRILAKECSKALGSETCVLHRKNIEFILSNWYKEDAKNAYILLNEESYLGANAMFLIALTESPYFEEYLPNAKNIAKGILSLQKSDGSFEIWYKTPNYAYDQDYLATFYSGEAILALLKYYEKTKEFTALNGAKLSQKYYLRLYVDKIDKNYFPAYVPWHTMSLSSLNKIEPNKKKVEAIFIMNDKLLELQDKKRFIGRFFNPQTPEFGSPHASSDAIYSESLAYALEIAKSVGDKEREKKYRDAIRLAIHNLYTLQYKTLSLSATELTSHYEGAIRTKAHGYHTRMDNTQHAIDAMEKILEIW